MILVADSGSSRSDWMLALPDSKPLSFTTKGLNPFFVNEKDIERVLKNVPEIIPYADEVSEVYFFGSGCSSPDRREIVSNALSRLFIHAFVDVEIDLVGSAYATCGTNKGFIATLGTGSDITFFDGTSILPSRHGIGYVLGDEGSGVWFGKQLITDYLYDRMPSELSLRFGEKYRINKETVIKNVYQKPMPNTYLASFAPFISDQIEHPYMEELLLKGFSEYIETDIVPYEDFMDYPCHFVGSIAYHFETHLRNVCNRYGVQVGMVLKNPIERLFDFVFQREKKYEIQL
jgi:glucosamine kinase